MQARLAIVNAYVVVELWEIELQNKPEAIGSFTKSTLPVLKLENGIAIDGAMDIMVGHYVKTIPNNGLHLLGCKMQNH